MTGYDAEARIAWQRALWPHRASIRRVTVVGAGSSIRFGARVLTTLLGVPCSFIEAPRASLRPGR